MILNKLEMIDTFLLKKDLLWILLNSKIQFLIFFSFYLSSSQKLCVCMSRYVCVLCLYMYVEVHMCMEVHVLVCEGQRVVPGVSLIFLTRGPALYETPVQRGWPAGHQVPLLSQPGVYRHVQPFLTINLGAVGTISGPYACRASILNLWMISSGPSNFFLTKAYRA